MFEVGVGGRALCDEVVAVSAGAERAEAGQVLTLADWYRDHGWLLDGQVTAVAWLVHHVGLLRKDANRLMKMARLCAAYEFIAKALAAGDIGVGHVHTIACHHTRERAERSARDEHVIVELARDRDLAVDDFATAMARWASNVDDELGVDPNVVKQRRGIYVSKTLHGYRLDGDLTDEDGIIIETAIAAIADRPDPADRPGGPRTKAQRRHDALSKICEHFLGCANDRAGSPIHTIDCVIDLDQFTQVANWFTHPDPATAQPATETDPGTETEPTGGIDSTADGEPTGDSTTAEPAAEPEPTGGIGSTADGEPVGERPSRGEPECEPGYESGCDPVPPGGHDDLGPAMTARDLLARRELRRPNGETIPIRRALLEKLICTSYLARVIMRGQSEVLDLGRRTRLFTAPQRRAILERDGPLCAVPGCTNPADVIHHDHRWQDNGGTDLDNGIPACDTHHDDFHEHRATIARNPDGTYTYTILHPRTRAS